MTYEQKDNSGTMFKNDKKGNEKRPDLNGSLKVTEPGEYWVSGWKGKTEKGDFKLSIKLEKKEKKEDKKEFIPEAPMSDDVDSDIPF